MQDEPSDAEQSPNFGGVDNRELVGLEAAVN